MATPNPYKEGTMSHAIFEEVMNQAPIQRREKGVSKRKTIKKVRATFAGTSKPQPMSVRAMILKLIQQSPESTCTIEEIEAHLNQDAIEFSSVRGYLQKLVEKNHIEVLGDE